MCLQSGRTAPSRHPTSQPTFPAEQILNLPPSLQTLPTATAERAKVAPLDGLRLHRPLEQLRFRGRGRFGIILGGNKDVEVLIGHGILEFSFEFVIYL